MKRVCLSIIVSKLMVHKKSKEQLESITKLLKIIDKSGDGKISMYELHQLFHNLEHENTKKEEHHSLEICAQICQQVSKTGKDIKEHRCKPDTHFKCIHQNLISYKDFVLCSLNLKVDNFILYMSQAQQLFFQNDSKSIGKCEF